MKTRTLIYLSILSVAITACLPPSVVFTVNPAGDESDINLNDGICETINNECTLRAAIMQVNAVNQVSIIEFENVGTISPGSALPPITVPFTTINGKGAVTLDGGAYLLLRQ